MSSDSASQTYGPLERMLPTTESDDWFDLAVVVPDWALADFNSAIGQSETVEPRKTPTESVAAGRTALPKARLSFGRATTVSDLRLASLIDLTGVEKCRLRSNEERSRGPIAVIAGVDNEIGRRPIPYQASVWLRPLSRSGRCDGLTYLGFAMQIELADILEAFRRLSDIQLIALSGAVGYLLGDIGYRLFLRSRIKKGRGSNN